MVHRATPQHKILWPQTSIVRDEDMVRNCHGDIDNQARQGLGMKDVAVELIKPKNHQVNWLKYMPLGPSAHQCYFRGPWVGLGIGFMLTVILSRNLQPTLRETLHQTIREVPPPHHLLTPRERQQKDKKHLPHHPPLENAGGAKDPIN